MSTTSGLVESSPPWLELPREITAMILHKLGAIEILATAEKVCPIWRSVCQDASMWQSIDMRNEGNLRNLRYDLDKMCRHAVDRSQGQLNDISIQNFATDDLLLYISERSNQLKSLELRSCNRISYKGLSEAFRKLPLLEELRLYYNCGGVEAIEAVGRSCPHLKLFKSKLNGSYLFPEVSDMAAMAVAQNMHDLQHLQLFGHKLTNEGLQAILDGCPHLESLDLRQCSNVDLSGDLGILCSQRIKDLRCPERPSTDGYAYDFSQFDGVMRAIDDEGNDYLSSVTAINNWSEYDRYNSDDSEFNVIEEDGGYSMMLIALVHESIEDQPLPES